ncbi:hypothetical protein HUO13_28605 [Saccharopolyspora erythraea]|uniref:hypothetical protein n=1 Tax=Saccharopolyspora erythraea TaxID=1836 RepID=UPI001BA46EC7|nr:hypothetical protein [Saccharopolyspora erythraea]QUH04226.1 hypothetical protein HUO13_28605 [Saccharopolyspora erythraea]
MSPDSDVIKWIVIAATLVQTTAAVIQVHQGRRTNPDAPTLTALGPVSKLLLATAITGTLWIIGFLSVYERRRSESGETFYRIRDEFADLSAPGILLGLGLFVLSALAGATIVVGWKATDAHFAGLSTLLVMVSSATAAFTVLTAAVFAYRDKDENILLMLAFAGIGAIVGGTTVNTQPERRGP